MTSMHMDGSYISGWSASLDKTFGGSLTQPTKSQFISQAALSSQGANIIHNIHYIQLFDKLVLALNTARTRPWWELDWNSESSYFKWPMWTDQWLCWQGNLTLKIRLLVMQVIHATDCVLNMWNGEDWNHSLCPGAFLYLFVELLYNCIGIHKL